MGQIKNEKLLLAIQQVLKELRSSKSLTQDAVIIDIYDNKNITLNLGRIETGNRNISPSTIFLLCEYYKITISEFFERVEEINPSLKIKK
jgi:transcriptional regulator with XRE-family HTH domain